MRLTQYSNFAIRILMYAGLRGGVASSLPEIARSYGISYNHLKKAAAELCRLGYLETARGRVGGVKLARAPEDIRIGDVIRTTEGASVLVECFDPCTNTCPLAPACQLKLALEAALAAFYAVLDGYTLADLLRSPGELSPLLGIKAPTAPAPEAALA